MEYVEGKSLYDFQQHHRRPFMWEEIQNYVEQICSALGYAHSQGVVHRDIKPDNIMISMFQEVKILDFEICQDREG